LNETYLRLELYKNNGERLGTHSEQLPFD
jgi:hypothetical protein